MNNKIGKIRYFFESYIDDLLALIAVTHTIGGRNGLIIADCKMTVLDRIRIQMDCGLGVWFLLFPKEHSL